MAARGVVFIGDEAADSGGVLGVELLEDGLGLFLVQVADKVGLKVRIEFFQHVGGAGRVHAFDQFGRGFVRRFFDQVGGKFDIDEVEKLVAVFRRKRQKLAHLAAERQGFEKRLDALGVAGVDRFLDLFADGARLQLFVFLWALQGRFFLIVGHGAGSFWGRRRGADRRMDYSRSNGSKLSALARFQRSR